MITIAYVFFGFILLKLVVSTINLVFSPKLNSNLKDFCSKISVLIPARNEEKNIELLLQNLLNQEYTNFEVIVFNDQSTDRTLEIIQEYASKFDKISIINSEGLPDGWMGKNYACHKLSENAKGEFILFLDADVRMNKNVLKDTVAYIKKRKTDLLTIFPIQLMSSFGESIVVPLMNQILLSLLPLPLVRFSRFSSLSAANGQFMMFKADTYRKFHPHHFFRHSKVEDIVIARFYKAKKRKIEVLVSVDGLSCKMYDDYKSSIEGFSKNVISFFGQSYIVASLYLLHMLGALMLVFFYLDMIFFVIAVFSVILNRIFVSMLSKQSVFKNLILTYLQSLNLGVLIIVSLIKKITKSYKWKGRNISWS